jgi:hypothetical protein
MTRKRTIKIIAIILATGISVALAIGIFLFNKPHRNVQEESVDFSLTATQLVDDYLSDPKVSDEKYLNEEGKSKIVAVTGEVYSKTLDLNNQVVIVLKRPGDKAGVSCTFMHSTNGSANALSVRQMVTIKGVIRSGASYDADLGIYEDVIIEKCDVLK